MTTENKPELKDCPCGRPAQIREEDPKHPTILSVVECSYCSFMAFIDDWNTRTEQKEV